MRLVARAAGSDDDEDDDVLEAGFAEHEDGSGIAVMFQRGRSAPEPWPGSPDETNLFNNTYCITVGSGETVYGGLRAVSFDGTSASFEINPEDADILGLEPRLDVAFEVSEQDLAAFRAMLPRVVTWGIPREMPELTGV